MSTDNEQEIRGRLDAALGTITPTRVPLDRVMRQGRAIRRRRRTAVAAGLAVVVGLGVALPGLVTHEHPAPPAQHPDQVTVNPPRSTPAKLMFSGTINYRPWRFELDWDRGKVVESGPGMSYDAIGYVSPDGQPAVLDGDGSSGRSTLAGTLRRDVNHLVLKLSGGDSVSVHAVQWHGSRWVGVMIPAGQPLTVAAYSDRGEVARAVTFDGGVNVWLRPGQPGLARQTVRIAAGQADGSRWSIYGYAGPWGICLRDAPGDGGCFAASRFPRGQLLKCELAGPEVFAGRAAPDVSYIRFRFSDGSERQVVIVGLAGGRYFGLKTGAHQIVTGWTAYSRSGQDLGGRSGPICSA